jgi:geranylgeranyl diphosphate synthase, type I
LLLFFETFKGKRSMLVQAPVKDVLARYCAPLQNALRAEVARLLPSRASTSSLSNASLEGLSGQISYHLGWVDAQFSPLSQHTGKLLRPTLLLLAYEAVGAWGLAREGESTTHLDRALPAACAVELFHNFTLLHDDIEDGDVQRRHRPTVWSLGGIPLAINTADATNCLSRLALFKLLDVGVDAGLVARLGGTFDHAALSVIEGQHLDLSFESQEQISISMYLDMITRKTAALMACATEIGARLGTTDQLTIERWRPFGLALGIAFKMRDELLGIWATHAASGKVPAGDVYRHKKTLPILHAFEQASAQDQRELYTFYQSVEPSTSEQVAQVLSILDRTHSREYSQYVLAEQCERARNELLHLPVPPLSPAQEAMTHLAALVNSVEAE